MRTRITLALLALMICLLPALEHASAARLPEGAAPPDPMGNLREAAPSQPPSGDDDSEMDCTRAMRYDWATQRRLDRYWHQVYMGYVNLIETYAWEGAITQAQKQTRLHYLKNYINTIKKHKYRWCSEHEPDEWEEEWYNSD